ncbi:MAG TPA: SDR family oxidoreductase [Sphingobacteriaceae bacterium]|nr:SDR family oxidoreductase [Sphingobacteriaceae bacterium]
MNAIVTGATKGIGKAISFTLAANNYNLFLCSRNSAELISLKRELKERNPRIHVFTSVTDCSDAEQVKRFADEISDCMDSPDVLVNNAGLYLPSKILNEDNNALDQQLQVNLLTPHYLCKFFGRKMREKRSGHIFNICSIASINPVTGAGSYSVTKFALLGLTKVLREELMEFGIKVTAILPGSTLTASWEGTKLPPECFVDPQDVADALISCLKTSKGGNIDQLIIRPTLGDI